MEAQRYLLWLHDPEGTSWFWRFEYPMNIRLFDTDVGF